MSHEKAKEQTKVKKQPTKSLKEKELQKKQRKPKRVNRKRKEAADAASFIINLWCAELC